MKIFQRRFVVYFISMLIIPAGIAYLFNLDRNVDLFFFVRAFAIALLLTLLYYILLKRTGKV
jgi:hypothetical protein